MKQGLLNSQKKNVRRHIRNVRKLRECQPTFGAALDERTHLCTMTAVSPYADKSTILFIG
jgi:hypothetical protein